MNTYGQAITQVSDIVFAGGDFKYMESAGGERVDQPYLADYNVDSGEPVRSFSASGSPSVDYHDGAHYYVRAVDTTDNYSASTKAVQAV